MNSDASDYSIVRMKNTPTLKISSIELVLASTAQRPTWRQPSYWPPKATRVGPKVKAVPSTSETRGRGVMTNKISVRPLQFHQENSDADY